MSLLSSVTQFASSAVTSLQTGASQMAGQIGTFFGKMITNVTGSASQKSRLSSSSEIELPLFQQDKRITANVQKASPTHEQIEDCKARLGEVINALRPLIKEECWKQRQRTVTANDLNDPLDDRTVQSALRSRREAKKWAGLAEQPTLWNPSCLLNRYRMRYYTLKAMAAVDPDVMRYAREAEQAAQEAEQAAQEKSSSNENYLNWEIAEHNYKSTKDLFLASHSWGLDPSALKSQLPS